MCPMQSSTVSFLSHVVIFSSSSVSCLPPEYTVKKLDLWRQHEGHKLKKKNPQGPQAVHKNHNKACYTQSVDS